MKRYGIYILIAALVGAGIYYLFKHRGDTHQAFQGGGLPVVTCTVTPQRLDEDLQAVGTLEANEAATIRAELAGMIKAIHFKEGQNVAKGDLLIEIEDNGFRTEVSRTAAAYDLAKITFDRRSELHKSGAASAQLEDEAGATLQQNKAAFDAAQIRLEKTRIQAPFNGIIGLRKTSVGDYLNVGDSITHIVSIDPMKVDFTVPEKYFSSLKEGLTVYLSVDAWPQKEFEGTLYAIDPKIDPDTRSLSAKALVPNPDKQLRPGMFAFIRLRVGEKENALLVPEEALIPSGNTMMVMKVVAGKAQPVPVKIGVRRGRLAEIVEGLSAGDEIITAGHMKVREGMPVSPIPAQVPPPTQE